MNLTKTPTKTFHYGRRGAFVTCAQHINSSSYNKQISADPQGGSVAEWLACWTQAQKGLGQIAATTLSGNGFRQTVHTQRASVHRAAKLVAALLRVAGVTAGLAESNGSLPSHHLQADCQEPGSASEPYARQSSMGYLYLFTYLH